MKIWKGNGNTTTLLFSLKRLEIVQQEIVRHNNGTLQRHLFHKSGPANMQHTNQPTYQPIVTKGEIGGLGGL